MVGFGYDVRQTKTRYEYTWYMTLENRIIRYRQRCLYCLPDTAVHNFSFLRIREQHLSYARAGTNRILLYMHVRVLLLSAEENRDRVRRGWLASDN